MTDWNRVAKSKICRVQSIAKRNAGHVDHGKFVKLDRQKGGQIDPVRGAIMASRASRQKAGKTPITLPTIRGLEGS